MRWLSMGEVSKRFISCLNNIITFLESKKIQYSDDKWLQKLYFMVDIILKWILLIVKIQGKGNITLSMLEEVTAFENRLPLFSEEFGKESIINFNELCKYQY